MKHKVPNLFIVGAAKAGTSSLWYLLKQHPKIFMPDDEKWKEPAYFSELKVKRVTSSDKYFGLFSNVTDEIYAGEASTAYLTDPSCARRLYDFNPDSRIIILLRNPIRRAYSLYTWMVQEGYEYSIAFEDALDREAKRKTRNIPNFFEPEYYSNYLYFESGLYCDQVLRYLKYFNQNRVFVGLFENFVSNSDIFLKEVLQFLNLSEPFDPESEPQNPSKQVIHPYLSFAMRKFIKLFWKLPLLEPPTIKGRRDFGFSLVTRDRKPDPIRRDTYQILRDRYEGEYQRLERELNLDLEPWKQADRHILKT